MFMRDKAFEYYIMNSNQLLYKVLPEFEAAIARGEDPNVVKPHIFAKYGASDSDFTDSDAKTLVSRVDSMYRRYHNI